MLSEGKEKWWLLTGGIATFPNVHVDMKLIRFSSNLGIKSKVKFKSSTLLSIPKLKF